MMGVAALLFVVVVGILFCSFLDWVYGIITWIGDQVGELIN